MVSNEYIERLEGKISKCLFFYVKNAKITVWGGPSSDIPNFFWRTKQVCTSKAFYSNPKDQFFFIVSDVMENGATNIKNKYSSFHCNEIQWYWKMITNFPKPRTLKL